MEFENSPIRVCVYGAYTHFEKSVLYYMFKKQKITVVRSLHERPDIVIVWDPWGRVKKNKKKMDVLKHYGKSIKKINFHLKSCQKIYTTKVFDELFGYNLGVDPKTYNGFCVAKHDDNGTKSCFFVKCPLNADDLFNDHVYQKIIDFKHPHDEKILCEVRVPIFKGIIPFVFFKERARGLRFTSKNRRVELANVENHLTPAEVEQIQNYCKHIGLEYGDLDILRDSTDGRIYIIDVNNTPWWPPNKLTDRDRAISLNMFWNTWLMAFMPSYYDSLKIPAEEVDDYVPTGGPKEAPSIDAYGIKRVRDPRERFSAPVRNRDRDEDDDIEGTDHTFNEVRSTAGSAFPSRYSIASRHVNNDVRPEDSVSNVGGRRSSADRSQQLIAKLNLF